MIIGVTHDSGVRAALRLAVSTKVAIGMPPQGERNYPSKLDHFVFLRKKKTAKGVEWEPDPDLMKHYGSGCKAFEITRKAQRGGETRVSAVLLCGRSQVWHVLREIAAPRSIEQILPPALVGPADHTH
jgi:hypothetical protein